MSWNLLFHNFVLLFFLSSTTGPVFSGFDKIYSVHSFSMTKATFPLLCECQKATSEKENSVCTGATLERKKPQNSSSVQMCSEC